MKYLIYDLKTGVTKGLVQTQDISARLKDGEGYINAPEDFNPKSVEKTKVVDGEVLEYEPPVDVEKELNRIRAIRNRKLQSCDWTQIPDAPVDAEAWRKYRQDLRDITKGDVCDIVWPEPPSSA